jgi:hypothetical protein
MFLYALVLKVVKRVSIPYKDRYPFMMLTAANKERKQI